MQEQCKQHGMFTWNELMTSDVKAAKEFYGKLLGWTMEDVHFTGMPYTLVKVNGREIGGIMATQDDTKEMPPMWGSYVAVDDVDALAGQVTRLGGRILAPPRDIPNVGRFCVLQDTQGAILTLITHTPQT